MNMETGMEKNAVSTYFVNTKFPEDSSDQRGVLTFFVMLTLYWRSTKNYI